MAIFGGQVPNGERTFLDINGDPLSSGSVFFYVPGTTNPKDTWTDDALTAVNTNPVLLDQAGRAIIWGQGLYRQVVQDQFGNTQWDQTTTAEPGFSDLEAINATITGNLTVNGNITTGSSSNLSIGGNLAIGGEIVANKGVFNGELDALNGLVVRGAIPNAVSPSGGAVTFFVDGVTDVKDMFASNIFPQGAGVGFVGDAALPWASMSAGAFFIESDEKLKRDIEDLDISGIDAVRRVKSRRYKLRTSDEEQLGFMAQELSLCTDGKIGSDGRVSLSGLIAVLWEALKELDRRFSELEMRVNDIAEKA